MHMECGIKRQADFCSVLKYIFALCYYFVYFVLNFSQLKVIQI